MSNNNRARGIRGAHTGTWNGKRIVPDYEQQQQHDAANVTIDGVTLPSTVRTNDGRIISARAYMSERHLASGTLDIPGVGRTTYMSEEERTLRKAYKMVPDEQHVLPARETTDAPILAVHGDPPRRQHTPRAETAPDPYLGSLALDPMPWLTRMQHFDPPAAD